MAKRSPHRAYSLHATGHTSCPKLSLCPRSFPLCLSALRKAPVRPTVFPEEPSSDYGKDDRPDYQHHQVGDHPEMGHADKSAPQRIDSVGRGGSPAVM